MGHNSGILRKPRRQLKRKLLPEKKTKLNSEPHDPEVIQVNAANSKNITTGTENDHNNNLTIEDILQHSGADHSYCQASSSNQKTNKYHICECQTDTCTCCIGCIEKGHLITLLQDKIKELEEQINMNQNKKNYIRDYRPIHKKILTSDERTKFYTGLPKKDLFYKLFDHLQPKIKTMRYWRGEKNTVLCANNLKRKYLSSPKKFGPQRKLVQIDEFLLVLMKLRLGLLELDLADRFNITTSTVSSTFFTWMKMLSIELKGMIEYPPQDHVFSNLPKDAHAFPRLRSILDCTEIFIERPRDLMVQSMTWSSYKHHNTAKILVGITPRGKISYLSKAWGGRTSDNHIVNESGYLDLLDPYDQVLADKGFTIANQLLLKHAELIIPPGVKGQEQMLPIEVDKTKKVANFRIHVERAIARMKEFHILNGVYPINMLPIVDQVVTVCGALCNFLPPLVTGDYLHE